MADCETGFYLVDSEVLQPHPSPNLVHYSVAVFTCGLNLCSSLLSHTCCASPILLLLSLHAENAMLSHQQQCKKVVSFLKLYHTICSYLTSTDTTLDRSQRSSESFYLLMSHLYNKFKALKGEKRILTQSDGLLIFLFISYFTEHIFLNISATFSNSSWQCTWLS